MQEEGTQEICVDNTPHYIYLIVDPRTKTPFYVGASLYPTKRLAQHMSSKHAFNVKLSAILTQLQEALILPELVILEVTTKEARNEREYFWIRHYCKLFPFSMCNVNGLLDGSPSRDSRKKEIQDSASTEFSQAEDLIPN